MEIKTKYKLGDEFWVMKDNKPVMGRIDHIAINVTLVPTDNYGHREVIEILYQGGGGWAKESVLFQSKEALLASL